MQIAVTAVTDTSSSRFPSAESGHRLASCLSAFLPKLEFRKTPVEISILFPAVHLPLAPRSPRDY